MRITNKIMQRNNLSNINTNKVYQDKLSTQMSTQKKVSRPSDDPVVSIRALRLRSNVTEVTQYYSKNIPDAESWLDVTEDALKNLTEIITNMIKQCTKASNGDLKSADRQIILEQLKALGDEVYSTGDADYAGRYVFTGYRTDTSLSFDKEYNTKYEITEQLDNSSITQLTKVNTGKLLDITANNYNDQNQDYKDITENSVSSIDVYRIRLAYDDCRDVDAKPSISFWEKDANGDLVGTIEMPMAVGLVGGATKIHPTAQVAVKMLGVKTAAELGQIIAAVGLANNMAAMKALATEGIQRGHMSLHARNLASTVGAKGEVLEAIVKQMVSEKKVRLEYAQELFEKYSK